MYVVLHFFLKTQVLKRVEGGRYVHLSTSLEFLGENNLNFL